MTCFIISILHKYDYGDGNVQGSNPSGVFQFYISTIMVLLGCRAEGDVALFQFYISTIMVLDSLRESRWPSRFQFYISTIMVVLCLHTCVLVVGFQFYISTIMVQPRHSTSGILGDFNST